MPIENILFIILSLSGGGAEYTYLKLLKNINRKKFILKVILFPGYFYDTYIPEDKQEVLQEDDDRRRALKALGYMD
jgi:hypothetical protein